MNNIDDLPPEHVSEIIQMALSDHISFSYIHAEYGINDKQVKTLMRDTLKSAATGLGASVCATLVTGEKLISRF